MTIVNVVYASQTGTAQEYAAVAARRLWQEGYTVRLTNIADLSLPDLAKMQICLIVVSTCGQGELPSSSQRIWNGMLRTGLSSSCLSDTRFAVLGLGDSSYEHYNYAAKKMFRRIGQLGGLSMTNLVLADEQSPGGIDDGLETWIGGVGIALHGLAIGRVDKRPWTSMYNLGPVDCDSGSVDTEQSGRVLSSRGMTLGSEKNVRMVRIGVAGARHDPGDVALIYPQSQDEDVGLICGRLQWDPLACYRFTPNRPDAVLPGFTGSLFGLLKHKLDIYSHPKRPFFRVASRYAESRDEAEKLLDIATDDYELYLDYCVRPRRTPLEILDDFRSVHSIPVDLVFDLFPVIRPRSFSIASCCDNKIDIAVSLVEYQTRWLVGGAPREGLASRFLQRVDAGDRVRVEIVPGDITLGALRAHEYETVVMIGAGTGIAPLRSIIQHIARRPVKPNVYVFYGCRSLAKDCLFREELESLEWIEYHALGSRDIGGTRRHIDVLLGEHSAVLKKLLLGERTIVFLSGNNHLPKLVKGSIDSIVGTDGYAASMARTGRFYYECWS